MAELIRFVRNHNDRSSDAGYQFEFLCDRCGNGYMSRFQPSKTGMIGTVAKAAGSIFGGVLGSAGYGIDELQKLRTKARDDAFCKGVEEAKKHFKLCTRCSRWVCPEGCWNGQRGLCKECAPAFAEEMSSAQAKTAAEQINERVREVDQTGMADPSRKSTATCPQCNAQVGTSKFCPECGYAVNATPSCASCGATMQTSSKFCPECGASRT